jgi:glycosyltransferase involved in cell wall biosynthesis
VPVIANRVAASEVIEDRETGYLVPLGDIKAMAERSRGSSNAPPGAKWARGREWAVSQFNTDRGFRSTSRSMSASSALKRATADEAATVAVG